MGRGRKGKRHRAPVKRDLPSGWLTPGCLRFAKKTAERVAVQGFRLAAAFRDAFDEKSEPFFARHAAQGGDIHLFTRSHQSALSRHSAPHVVDKDNELKSLRFQEYLSVSATKA